MRRNYVKPPNDPRQHIPTRFVEQCANDDRWTITHRRECNYYDVQFKWGRHHSFGVTVYRLNRNNRFCHVTMTDEVADGLARMHDGRLPFPVIFEEHRLYSCLQRMSCFSGQYFVQRTIEAL